MKMRGMVPKQFSFSRVLEILGSREALGSMYYNRLICDVSDMSQLLRWVQNVVLWGHM
jgi:hypothetical protein